MRRWFAGSLLIAAAILRIGGVAADEPEVDRAQAKLVPAVTVDGKKLEFAVYFSGRFAVEFDPEDSTKVAAVYNLDSKSWREIEKGLTVTSAVCQRWVDASTERTRRSLKQQSDPDLVRFVQASLDPQFQVSDGEGVVVLANDVLTYRLSDPLTVDEATLRRFLLYDRLNAYRKAMVDGKLPPNAQLAVDAELERRRLLPGKMEMVIKVKGRIVKLDCRNRIENLTSEEKDRVAAAIKSAASKLPASADPF